MAIKMLPHHFQKTLGYNFAVLQERTAMEEYQYVEHAEINARFKHWGWVPGYGAASQISDFQKENQAVVVCEGTDKNALLRMRSSL